jgi:hypothetical protein
MSIVFFKNLIMFEIRHPYQIVDCQKFIGSLEDAFSRHLENNVRTLYEHSYL